MNRDSLTSSFFNLCALYLSWLIDLARTSSILSNRTSSILSKSRHHCLVCDLRRKAFSLLPLRTVLTVDFHLWYLLCWGSYLFFLVLLSVFAMKAFWFLSNTSASIKIIWFTVVIIILNINMNVNKMCWTALHSRDYFNWSWYVILFICCCIWFARILKRTFESLFVNDTVL